MEIADALCPASVFCRLGLIVFCPRNIFARIGYWNNANMPNNCQLVTEDSIGKNEKNSVGTQHNSSLKLFDSFKMAKESIVIGYAWLTLNIVNYAVLLGSENLGLTSMYVNFVCIALVDIPAVLINYNTLDRIGRKKGTIFSSLICIFALAALTWVPNNNNTGLIRLSAAMVTRLFWFSLLFCNGNMDY